MSTATNPLSGIAKITAKIEPHELKAVVLAFLYFFFLLGSYFILRPVRDAMGTHFDENELAQLWTGTFFGAFVTAPIFAWFSSRLKLSTLLPWVYGFIVINLLIFYALFVAQPESRPLAATFYIWVSVMNMLIISVFWSFMADLFSRSQSKRLFGVVAAGGSVGGVVGPLLTTLLVNVVGVATLLLISAVGFTVVIGIMRLLVKEKAVLLASGEEVQATSLDRKLSSNPFAGFSLLLKSPFLLLIAAFVLLLTWISTILYFQQQDFIAKAFETREARTAAFAVVDVIVNAAAIAIQLFGTSRIVTRFGITTGLVLNPIIMIIAFLAVAISPMLMVLLSVQAIRRVSEYAIAKPSREMLFTAVDQETKYKAKNVIDTVVYRFGDLSAAWGQAGLAAAGLGVVGVALFGVAVAVVWGAVALVLGRRFEQVRDGTLATAPAPV
jgi:AAA family ATP:ADP antiporter